MTEVQNEKAFQKQDAVFVGKKSTGKKSGAARFWKDIGLGVKTPQEAKTGTYIDNKCPFTGNVSIRGRILDGVVVSTKMRRTCIIRRDYLHYVKKYNRFEKRHTNTACHVSPCFRINEGDRVVVGQCRPLSKTVRFNVIKVLSSGKKSGKQFAKF